MLADPEGLLALEKATGLRWSSFLSQKMCLDLQSEESSDCKYFRAEYMLLRRMRSEGCIVKTLVQSRVVWLIVTFQKVTALSLILAVVSST